MFSLIEQIIIELGCSHLAASLGAFLGLLGKFGLCEEVNTVSWGGGSSQLVGQLYSLGVGETVVNAQIVESWCVARVDVILQFVHKNIRKDWRQGVSHTVEARI